MDGMLCWLVVSWSWLQIALNSGTEKGRFIAVPRLCIFLQSHFCACRTALVCPDDGLELRCVSNFAEDHSFKPTAVMPADIFSYVGGVFWLVCVCVSLISASCCSSYWVCIRLKLPSITVFLGAIPMYAHRILLALRSWGQPMQATHCIHSIGAELFWEHLYL